MKKIFFLTALFMLSVVAFGKGPGGKVLTAFQKQFPKVTNVQWYGEGKASIAYFSEGGITFNLSYNDKGKLLSTIRYYDERFLPVFVKTAVQSRFSGFSIYGVTELTTGGRTVYQVHLQDAGTLVTVLANKDGELLETARYYRY